MRTTWWDIAKRDREIKETDAKLQKAKVLSYETLSEMALLDSTQDRAIIADIQSRLGIEHSAARLSMLGVRINAAMTVVNRYGETELWFCTNSLPFMRGVLWRRVEK